MNILFTKASDSREWWTGGEYRSIGDAVKYAFTLHHEIIIEDWTKPEHDKIETYRSLHEFSKDLKFDYHIIIYDDYIE